MVGREKYSEELKLGFLLKNLFFFSLIRIVSKDGDTQYWATDVLDMQEEKRKE